MQLPGRVVVQSLVAEIQNEVDLRRLAAQIVNEGIVIIQVDKSVAGNPLERILQFRDRVVVIGIEDTARLDVV